MYSLVVENIKCIIAAGGLGTRLQEFRGNKSTKILLDVNGTPMINRQISQLVNWGMRKFVIITNPEYFNMIQEVTLGEFKDLEIEFTIQEEPKGISHALYQAKDYVDKNEKILFVLGDNFFGENPMLKLENRNFESMIFLKKVLNPNEFGVAKILNNNLIDIEEKPDNPSSDLAVVGLYLYSLDCFELIKKLNFSQRGELEISDLNNELIKTNSIQFEILDSWWIDAGTEERIEELKKLIL